ncbi:hypothetical protein, variant 2 [Aphanomyces astaci]|nr:hypothetical protein, variant 2 [Aphanomyces astaci]ETV64248.1 hypothetical protein, variant 2 [Aphanomyces astaci]|eukprot:XP_009846267.1 hypothetical protein, variant 2 [Aphanomyces astaci]
MKVKMLRASCLARELEPRGKKRILVQRLTESLEKQRDDEAASRHEAEVAEERRKDKLGGIWTFGTGTQGQLGHNDCQSYALPTQIKSTRGLGVCQVYAGFDSDVTFAVTRLGDVYVWGTKHGPTGLPRPKRRNRFDVVGGGGGSSPPPKGALHLPNLPTLDGPEEHVPADVVDPVDPPDNSSDESSDDGSSDDADALHDDKVGEGENMVEDESMLVPAPVKLKSISGEDIVQIAVGRVHCAARSKCGDVFTWGQNDHCQLGNEPQHSLSAAQSKRAKIKYGADAVEPTIWSRTVPETCVVRGVAVGTDHTMILSDVGDIYAFGSVYNTTDHSTLSRHLRKHRVHQVSCGAMHAAMVNENGQMYTWGSGDGGRLGHGDLASHVAPRLVEALASDVVFQISCGCWHTVAIVLVPPLLKGGFVYAWGTGRYGQLALGGNQVVPTPTLIQDFLMQCVYIKRVCAGMYHNVALSVDDEVYTWGSNVNGCLGRPTEMASNPESFSAVPGKVEGMAEFVGRPCSVAVGREYTVVATKPYIGPSEDQVEAARVEEAARVAAIAKQYEAEERKEELREALIERLQRSRCIEYLNSHHPLCNQCPIAGVCPGFQRDEIDPQLCQQCLHIKQSHDGQHRESNKAMGLDELRVLLERLHVTDDDLDLYIPDDELLIESRK